MREDPLEFWNYWGTSIEEYENATPHKGYFLLYFCYFRRYEIIKKWREEKVRKQKQDLVDFFQLELDRKGQIPTSFFVYTSNVDGLFFKSGIPREELLEIHGNASTLQCSKGVDCTSSVWKAQLPIDRSSIESLPKCQVCGKTSRPSVLMFNDEEWLGLEGEGTSDFDLYDTWEETMEKYLSSHKEDSLVIVEIGCGDRVEI